MLEVVQRLKELAANSDTRNLVLVLRGTILIKTCDQHKNLYITLFLPTPFGPDYYVPR